MGFEVKVQLEIAQLDVHGPKVEIGAAGICDAGAPAPDEPDSRRVRTMDLL